MNPEKVRVRKKKRRLCAFCVDKQDIIDYKDISRLRKYVSERGKILPRRNTGNCAKHQRAVTEAIKKARAIGFLPFVVE
ncbi:MAG: 30S ribosomal protein S18 [Candidatus Margulisiibacteriota bacterium]|nr:MAG: 30S ribosomal protein S18 [Candidatus Margulisbacteria bacterium GWD2_39_127]OGI03936.1 MAG: 30S ribosomal protein S18 [Candidatus Margulisbacteria bacterium GWF2_38_17]OGI08206.1 MAG: 30S ribosomal protein S18 [Candidatus Margulisbacteria bacterium GWE2_39_32]PZM79678.1 MAG: 30S ribosomal protein S18 [Candidatus Margulisiibacteriota bacterium]HAR61929.1 30S ribosomal protein S18 [Candidatus Margulisiibacteriota bacterium]